MSAPNAVIVGKVAIKVVPNTDSFRADAKRELRAAEAALDPIKIDFTANVRSAVNEVRDAVRQAQKAAQDVDIEVDVGQASKRKAQAELAVLARTRVASIVPKVNKTAAAKVAATLGALTGARALGSAADSIAEFVGGLDKAIPKIGATSLAVTNLSSSLLAGTSNLLAFSSSLASTAGAALALPGIFAGFAVGAGATFAVLKDFNKILPEVAGKFTALQDRMSGRFWDVAEAPFRSFINGTFPEFARGMERTSTALGGFFANLANSARQVFDGQLSQMFADTARSIDVAGRFTENYIGILEKLGSVGAGNLPRLAGYFGDISRTFDNWLGSKGQNGLQEYVDTGVAALKDLGGVIAGTGSLLAGLARAAEKAGGGSLSALRDTMEGAAKAVNSARFQRNLTGTFEAAHMAMDRLTRQSGPAFEGFMVRLSDTLGKVLPRAGETGGKALAAIFDALDRPTVERSVVKLFDDLDRAVGALAPTLPGVAKAAAAVVDTLGDLTVNVARGAAPALETLGPAIEDLTKDLRPLITQLGNLLVNAVKMAAPVLEDLGSTLGGLGALVTGIVTPINVLLQAMQRLPEPVKSLGSSVAAATIAFIALNAAISGIAKSKAGLALASLSTSMRSTEGRAKAMGTAMRGAAGVGGMLALAASSQTTSQSLRILGSTAGGALLGFQVGGPWGAAIGAGAGALYGLSESTDATRMSMEEAKGAAVNYAASLNQITGAATRATKAEIARNLQQRGVLDSTGKLGIATRDMVNAILGQEGAQRRVNAALQGAEQHLARMGRQGKLTDEMFQDMAPAITQVSGFLAGMGQDFRQASRDVKEVGQATLTWKQALKGLPEDVRVKLKNENYRPTMQQLREIARTGKGLSKDQIRIVIKALGIKATVADIRGVNKELKNVGKAKHNMGSFERMFKGSMGRVKRDATLGGLAVAKNLKQETGKAKADLNPFARSVTSGVQPAQTAATTGGQGVGSNLKAGVLAGFAGTQAALVAQASAAVRAAVSAARAAAKIKSPSRAMMEVGRYMGEGLVIGLERKIKSAKKAGDKLAKAVFNKNFVKSLAKATNQAEEIFRKLLDKVGKKGAANMRRRFGDDVKALGSLANKLKSISQKMQEMQKQVAQTVIEFANPVDIGGNYEGIISSMEDARVQAEAFQKVIKQLIKQGLNKTTLRQILAAGPEAGLATAEAILSGGVKQVNSIQKEINKAAQGVGKASGGYLFGGLLDQAQADVDKLIGKLGPLQKQLKKFAKDLVDSLRKEMNAQFKKAKNESAKKVTSAAANKPKSASVPTAKAFAASTAGNTGGSNGGGVTLVYNAFNSQSLSSEEALFAAARRGRMAFSR